MTLSPFLYLGVAGPFLVAIEDSFFNLAILFHSGMPSKGCQTFFTKESIVITIDLCAKDFSVVGKTSELRVVP